MARVTYSGIGRITITPLVLLIMTYTYWVEGSEVLDDGVGSRVRRAVTDLTDKQHRAYVAKHNELRSQVTPSASNMQYMVYASSLADTAQEWSQKCDFRHSRNHPSLTLTPPTGYGDNYGENLAATNSTSQPEVNFFLQKWYDEVSDYRYDNNSCDGVCGHYTQVVWAESNAVGCGVHHCSDGVTNSDGYIFGGQAAWVVTCHYGPAGNYVGQKPYLSGPSCTQCASGVQCLNNLCDVSPSNPTSGPDTGSESTEDGDDTESPVTVAGADAVPQTVSSTSTTPPPSCQLVCENGGVMNTGECSCQCTSGYQGGTCQFNTVQVSFTVIFSIRHDIPLFSVLRPVLLGAIVGALNSFCSDSSNYRRCCPQIGILSVTSSVQLPNFTGLSSVQVALGYPSPVTNTVYAVGVVALHVSSPLCSALDSNGRKRRSTSDSSEQHRIKRQSGTYLDPDVLYDAVAASLDDIRQQLADADNTADLVAVAPANPEATTTPGTTTTPTDPTAIIIIAVAAGVTVFVITLCICCVGCYVVSGQNAERKDDQRPNLYGQRARRSHSPVHDPKYDHYRFARRAAGTRSLAPAPGPDFDYDPTYNPGGYSYVSPPASQPQFDPQGYALPRHDRRRPPADIVELHELSQPSVKYYYI